MSEPQSSSLLGGGKGPQLGTKKGRTLMDVLLVSFWVAGYALILGAFRITKALESRF